MGQAKNRKDAIELAKAAGPKGRPQKPGGAKLISVSAYYKVDRDVGLGVIINNDMANVSEISQLITEGADSHNAEIARHGGSADNAEFAADLIQEMDDYLVPTICLELYGQPTQPNPGTRKNVTVTELAFQLFLVFMMNVKWLEDNGYLVSDDSNGMFYVTQLS